MKTFFIKFFGCQYNEWDAVRLSSVLQNFGLQESDKDAANIIFLLNCSVRKSAVDRSFGLVKNFLAQGKQVIVTGCILDDDRKKFEKKGCLIWDGEDTRELNDILGVRINILPTTDYRPLTNLVPIMKGCNNFCSYCAVPYTRGREVSRPMEEILDDVKKIIKSGGKEIMLLGQNVNSYHSLLQNVISSLSATVISSPEGDPLGRVERSSDNRKISPPRQGESRNDNEKNNFAQLLQAINDLPGNFTVKFTSNHPKDMSDDIIEAIATLPKIAKEVHLPLQSGSNKVLKSMNRPYTAEEYLKLVESLKLKVHKIKISTDVIVGFPTETEEDFQKTVEIFKEVKFSQAYINKYSPRSGTIAFKLGDPIPWTEKDRRWQILNEIILNQNKSLSSRAKSRDLPTY